MLSVEIIDQIRKEEERLRREQDAPVLRVPLDDPGLVPLPDGEPEESDRPTGGKVVVLDLSQDDVDEFRVAHW